MNTYKIVSIKPDIPSVVLKASRYNVYGTGDFKVMNFYDHQDSMVATFQACYVAFVLKT